MVVSSQTAFFILGKLNILQHLSYAIVAPKVLCSYGGASGIHTVADIAWLLSITGYTGGLCDLDYSGVPDEVRVRPSLCCLIADECFCKSCMDLNTIGQSNHPFFEKLVSHTNAIECSEFVGCLLPEMLNEIWFRHWNWHFLFGTFELRSPLGFHHKCHDWFYELFPICESLTSKCAPEWGCDWGKVGSGDLHEWVIAYIKDRPYVEVPFDPAQAWSFGGWFWIESEYSMNYEQFIRMMLNHMNVGFNY